jgi:Bacterial TSP3 repeat
MKHILIAAAFAFALAGQAHAADTDGDGAPNAAEKVLGTDPAQADTDGDGVADLKDKDPVFAENTIVQTGKPNGFTLTGQVEDNVNPETKKSADDHLELNIKNTSGEDLKSLMAYYAIKDAGTGKTEAYLKPLTDLVIAKGKSAVVHFDDAKIAGHFRANPNSSYIRSENAKIFTVEVSAEGFAPVKLEIKKDAGGAEQPD